MEAWGLCECLVQASAFFIGEFAVPSVLESLHLECPVLFQLGVAFAKRLNARGLAVWERCLSVENDHAVPDVAEVGRSLWRFRVLHG